MPVLTTTIGAFPKPSYLNMETWVDNPSQPVSKDKPWEKYSKELLSQATKDVMHAQANASIDIPTDGEVRREHYIYYFLKHMEGFDFVEQKKRNIRGTERVISAPRIIREIRNPVPFMQEDYEAAQDETSTKVKITLPGPMTIMNSVVNEHYTNKRLLVKDLIKAINGEVKALADAGCKWIQIDEPMLARKPKEAVMYGIKDVEKCFEDVNVNRVVHLCCGYPRYVDQLEDDVYKADPNVYFDLAPALDNANFDAVSIEDAHRNNDLQLLELFKRKKVILGTVAIAKTQVETVDDITKRLYQAKEHIDPDRLMTAPDCGLGMLSWDTAAAKLKNLSEAAKRV